MSSGQRYEFPMVAIVGVGARAAAQLALAAVTGSAADADNGFSVPLSASGALPATHYGVCGNVRAATRAALSQASRALRGLQVFDGASLGISDRVALWEHALQSAGLAIAWSRPDGE